MKISVLVLILSAGLFVCASVYGQTAVKPASPAPAAVAAAKGDVTSKLEDLGSPLSEKYRSGASVYARNIWTLFAYDGKIFLGGGNSSNEGPASNAGPVPVMSFDPARAVRVSGLCLTSR